MTLSLKAPVAAATIAQTIAMTRPPTPVRRIDPSTQAFVDSLEGAKPLYMMAPEAARAVLTDAQRSVEVPLLDVAIQDRVLEVGPEGLTDIRVVRPAGATGVLPAGAESETEKPSATR